MYLTYEQYKTLGGTLEENVFNNLETQAFDGYEGG